MRQGITSSLKSFQDFNVIPTYYQLRITLGFVGLALAAVIIGEVLVYQVFWPLTKALPRDTAMIIRPQLFTIVFWYSVPIVLFVILGGIVITHRFAGPVYHIERKLDKLLQGEPIELIARRHGEHGVLFFSSPCPPCLRGKIHSPVPKILDLLCSDAFRKNIC